MKVRSQNKFFRRKSAIAAVRWIDPKLFLGIILGTNIGILYSSLFNTSSKVTIQAPVTQKVEILDDKRRILENFVTDSNLEKDAVHVHVDGGTGIAGEGGNENGPARRNSVMIMAVYPNSIYKMSAIWSQLECFSKDYDTIIISCQAGDDLFNTAMINFGIQLSQKMPEVAKKIGFIFKENEVYDTGLWCNALRYGEILGLGPDGSFVGGTSEYTDFFLINDSVHAVEHSTELRDTLFAKNLDLVSYSFWDEDKEDSLQNPYWVESYARAFSREGMQIFADKFCFRKERYSWRNDCPDMLETESLPSKERRKKCIVRITETEVASLYAPHKVHGIYPGQVPEAMVENGQFTFAHSWTGHYPFWSEVLRSNMNFPLAKISDQNFMNHAILHRPNDFATCTTNLDEDVRTNMNRPFVEFRLRYNDLLTCTKRTHQVGAGEST